MLPADELVIASSPGLAQQQFICRRQTKAVYSFEDQQRQKKHFNGSM
jgi:hypothetical protein